MEQKDLEHRVIDMLEQIYKLNGELKVLNDKLTKLEKLTIFFIKVLLVEGIMLIISNVELVKEFIDMF